MAEVQIDILLKNDGGEESERSEMSDSKLVSKLGLVVHARNWHI